MSVVKLKNKKELDNLVANLTLRLGKKISQQDVLDACIELSKIHLDELEFRFSKSFSLSEKRIKQILDMADDFEYDTSKSIDQDLYGD